MIVCELQVLVSYADTHEVRASFHVFVKHVENKSTGKKDKSSSHLQGKDLVHTTTFPTNLLIMASQSNAQPPQPVDYSLPGVMRYLQTEWQRNERDRIQWDLERAEMKV